MPNTPIVNAGLLYVNGLGIAKTAAKKISIAAGTARDETDTNDISLSSLITVNGATVGVNGVDIAAVVASSMYAVYVIGDSTDYQPTAGLLSLNATTPSLPFGYDMSRRVGWVLTDGSANILQFWQLGQGQTRVYYYDVGISALSAGSATTFTAINLSTSVPPLATQVIMDIAFSANAAGDVAQFLPFGSSATNGIVRFGTGVIVGTAVQVGQIVVPCELNSGVPEILYKVATSDSLTLLTTGFYDYLT
jgi:hypothetical protein